MGILELIISSVLGVWISSQEWRFRQMQSKLNKSLEKKEIEHLIDIKTEYTRRHQDDVKDDIKRLEKKIDKLVELSLNK